MNNGKFPQYFRRVVGGGCGREGEAKKLVRTCGLQLKGPKWTAEFLSPNGCYCEPTIDGTQTKVLERGLASRHSFNDLGGTKVPFAATQQGRWRSSRCWFTSRVLVLAFRCSGNWRSQANRLGEGMGNETCCRLSALSATRSDVYPSFEQAFSAPFALLCCLLRCYAIEG
jgi:hypothetical protein